MKKTKVKESHTRYNSIEWYGELRDITIGGVGTIGSWLSIALARAGDHTLILYDDDTVDMVNLSGQAFGLSHIGKSKVVAISEIIQEFTEFNIENLFSMEQKVEKGTEVTNVCFSCFDNMKARKVLFDEWCKLEDRELFIDGRMTIESYEVYTVHKGEEEKYRKTLFNDKDIPDQVCSLKNTSHTGMSIASTMTTIFTNHLGNTKMGINMREVPFHIRNEMQLLNIEICK